LTGIKAPLPQAHDDRASDEKGGMKAMSTGEMFFLVLVLAAAASFAATLAYYSRGQGALDE
jgi:hypothetical protein